MQNLPILILGGALLANMVIAIYCISRNRHLAREYRSLKGNFLLLRHIHQGGNQDAK